MSHGARARGLSRRGAQRAQFGGEAPPRPHHESRQRAPALSAGRGGVDDPAREVCRDRRLARVERGNVRDAVRSTRHAARRPSTSCESGRRPLFRTTRMRRDLRVPPESANRRLSSTSRIARTVGSLVARRAHNPKVAGSDPAPAICTRPVARASRLRPGIRVFCWRSGRDGEKFGEVVQGSSAATPVGARPSARNSGNDRAPPFKGNNPNTFPAPRSALCAGAVHDRRVWAACHEPWLSCSIFVATSSSCDSNGTRRRRGVIPTSTACPSTKRCGRGRTPT